MTRLGPVGRDNATHRPEAFQLLGAAIGGDNRCIEPRTGLWTMGLPLRAPRSTCLATLALALYYCVTMARDLSLYDSGELALAAVQLGLAHPPGQPLHTLLGFVLAHLPGVPALIGANLASALPGALTLIPATSLADRMLGRDAAPLAVRGVPWLLAIAAMHPSLWEPATRVEVYALATFTSVFSLALGAELVDRESSRLPALALGIALGACASVNPVIALLTAIALAPAIVQLLIAQPARIALGAKIVAGGLIGLLPYAYLPLVAQRTDVMVWGAPNDAASYARYLLLRDYAHNQGITFAPWLAHATEWLQLAAALGLAPMIGIGILGHVWCAKSKLAALTVPALYFLLVAWIAVNVVWHVDVPDYNGYLAAPLWGLLAGVFALCMQRQRLRSVQAIFALLAIATVAPVLVVTPAPWARTRSEDRLARSWAGRVLAEAPRGAIVLAESDAIAGALFYLQGAERARPDVTVVAYGLASSSWHWDQLLRAHPDLTPFSIRGSGGRVGRLRRLLEANFQRAVLVESFHIGRELGLRMCAGGLYLRTGWACAGGVEQNPAVAAELARDLARLGDGSPSAAGAIAQVSYSLGEALWRLGDARAAHDVLLAGVPVKLWPARVAMSTLEGTPALPPTAAGMRYARPAALGDPGRNLFLAGAIVSAAGELVLARDYIDAAAGSGLPEARALHAINR